MMNGQKVVKVFNHEGKAVEEFNELNDKLFDSAYNANKFANILMPINAQLGNISYVLCAIVGGVLAFNHFAGLTLGGLVAFMTFNKNFSQPINQISMQLNSIIMALAGADRIFKLLDEKPEEDDGYVNLVNAKIVDGKIEPSEERTGMWAWKHPHSAHPQPLVVSLRSQGQNILLIQQYLMKMELSIPILHTMHLQIPAAV